VEIAKPLGTVHADMAKTREILLNLLNNAAKFTEAGRIRLEARRESEQAQEWISFTVRDEGIGMTLAQQKNLFVPFTQADSSTSRRYGGTGLGLALSKEYVEMLGGTIAVHSEFGRGSTFTVRLPVKSAEQPVVSLEENFQADGVVLVIDDDPIIRELLRNYLGKLGYSVAVATTGEEGLNLARKLRPDAVLLDVMMPEMDGWQVLSVLKSDPAFHDIPVIMTSIEEHHNIGYALGATDYMTKPVGREQLVKILAKYKIGGSGKGAVMVVEDDRVIRELLGEMLKQEGWRVIKAENGRQALELLETKKPALILLDLSMPEMDGYEFVTCLQKKEEWRAIPVVVLTSTPLSAEDQARLHDYVQGIMRKEACSHEELLKHIQALLGSAK
jgi:CheY-like chemotaxis protein/anti-sigma regulatory factor (Ser/Thr protein kinase)